MNKLTLTFTRAGEGWDISVVIDGKEVEAGCLVQHPALPWTSLVLRYLIDHRLCTACPDSSTADKSRSASSTRASQPKAFVETPAGPFRAKRRYPLK